MRGILALGTVVLMAAFVGVTTANADPGGNAGRAAPPPTTTTTYGFIPDAGVAITTDPSKLVGHTNLTPTATAKATARGSIVPVTCGTCGGGGDVTGCATVYVNNGDGYGNWVKAYYHWCWLNGSISSNYGWGDEAACWGFCNFLGWNYNFDFGNGHQDKGTFRDVSGGVFHVDSSDAACVAVDGWGNSWGC